MEQAEGLIGLREAARRLGVGSYTVRRLIRAGELRAFRVGSLLRVSPLDLRRYLKSHPADGSLRSDSRSSPRSREG